MQPPYDHDDDHDEPKNRRCTTIAVSDG